MVCIRVSNQWSLIMPKFVPTETVQYNDHVRTWRRWLYERSHQDYYDYVFEQGQYAVA